MRSQSCRLHWPLRVSRTVGTAGGPVNALIHRPGRPAPDPSTRIGPVVDELWITGRATGRQPPIANISTRGRPAVASERSSE
jgi:hypothetical protein